jgi:uncharacterized membrane protein YciS (DUF1049 family)
MSTLLTVTIALAVLIGIILAALTFGVMLLTKVRPNPFARSSYTFLALCAGVAYLGLTLVWLVSALMCIVVREPASAAATLACAFIGGVGGTFLLRTAYRCSVLPDTQNVAARAAWVAVLETGLAEDVLPAAMSLTCEEAKSPLLCRAVEELFIPDNIHPEKWLGNWIAFNHVNDFELYLHGVETGLHSFANVTPSARKLLERWWVLPPRGTWFLAAYPDVDLWWDTALKEAARARRKGEGDAVASLEHKVFGAIEESDLEKADEDTVNLLFKRMLVHYYRSNVNPRLECQA